MQNTNTNWLIRSVRGLILALSVLGAATSPAWAQSSGNTIDVGYASPTSGTGWKLSGNVFTITGNVNIKGTTSTRRVEVASGSTQKTITVVDYLYIDASSGQGDNPAIKLIDDGNVALHLNSGTATWLAGGDHAPGLQVQGNSVLWFEGEGSLVAYGGSLAAGIGGGYYQGPFGGNGENSGKIYFGGAVEVTAYGGGGAAGIGGGGGNGGDGGSGQVWIGGNSTIAAIGGASGVGGGAGIGGGSCGGNDNQITITENPNVIAKGSSGSGGGAGIGGGGCLNHVGSGKITINPTSGTLNVTAGSGTYPGSAVGEGGWGGHTGMGLTSVTPPKDSGAPIGGSANYSMSATTSGSPAPAVSYDWYVNGTYYTSGWTASITNTSGSMSVAANLVASGGGMAGGSKVWYQFYPKLTTYTGSISFATQPANITVRQGHIGGNIRDRLSATVNNNNGGTLSYQWYRWFVDAATKMLVWSEIPGATGGLTYTPPYTLTAGTYQYSVVVSATNASSIQSDIAAVTVLAPDAAPQLFNQQVYNITANSADFSVDTDTDATAIWTVVAGTASCPTYTAAQATGQTAGMTYGLNFSRTLTNLTASTNYKLCFYALNTLSNAVTPWEKTFTTAAAPAVTFLNAVSRKTHGTAGAFNLPLGAGSLTAGSNITVEPRRSADGAFDVVFTFSGTVTSASASLSGAMSGTVTPTISHNGSTVAEKSVVLADVSTVTVHLTNVPDTKRVGVTLTVNGIANAATAYIGFLYGDVSQNRQVQGTDSTAVRARMGAPLDTTNFMYDVNVNGAIQGTDDTIVRSLIGNSLP